MSIVLVTKRRIDPEWATMLDRNMAYFHLAFSVAELDDLSSDRTSHSDNFISRPLVVLSKDRLDLVRGFLSDTAKDKARSHYYYLKRTSFPPYAKRAVATFVSTKVVQKARAIAAEGTRGTRTLFLLDFPLTFELTEELTGLGLSENGLVICGLGINPRDVFGHLIYEKEVRHNERDLEYRLSDIQYLLERDALPKRGHEKQVNDHQCYFFGPYEISAYVPHTSTFLVCADTPGGATLFPFVLDVFWPNGDNANGVMATLEYILETLLVQGAYEVTATQDLCNKEVHRFRVPHIDDARARLAKFLEEPQGQYVVGEE